MGVGVGERAVALQLLCVSDVYVTNEGGGEGGREGGREGVGGGGDI